MVVVDGEPAGQELPGPLTVKVVVVGVQPETPPTGVEPEPEPDQSLHEEDPSRRTTGLALTTKLELTCQRDDF
jgi:hypothetical protein